MRSDHAGRRAPRDGARGDRRRSGWRSSRSPVRSSTAGRGGPGRRRSLLGRTFAPAAVAVARRRVVGVAGGRRRRRPAGRGRADQRAPFTAHLTGHVHADAGSRVARSSTSSLRVSGRRARAAAGQARRRADRRRRAVDDRQPGRPARWPVSPSVLQGRIASLQGTAVRCPRRGRRRLGGRPPRPSCRSTPDATRSPARCRGAPGQRRPMSASGQRPPGASAPARRARARRRRDDAGRPRRASTARCRDVPPHQLIEEVERSGLRGRGGADFPTARKLRAVAERRRVGPAGRQRLGDRAGQRQGPAAARAAAAPRARRRRARGRRGRRRGGDRQGRRRARSTRRGAGGRGRRCASATGSRSRSSRVPRAT